MKAVLLFLFAVYSTAKDEAAVDSDSKINAESIFESCECVPHYNCMTRSNGDHTAELLRPDKPCHKYEVCCLNEDRNDLLQRNRKCGVHVPERIGFELVLEDNEAAFGEFTWMAAVFYEQEENSTKTLVYRCGGALIHPQVVTTAAHCLVSGKESNFIIRVGEWDTQIDQEVFPHQDRRVKTVITHPEFNVWTFLNDIALVILEKPVEMTEIVDVVCLPSQDVDVAGPGCMASGWGKDSMGGNYSNVLKKMELRIVPSNSCEKSLRETSLGKNFQLHGSFMCASDNPGEDICRRDGGSPLVCPIPELPRHYFQAGIVSWGIGCGDDGVPGVYTNLAKFSGWIDEQLTRNNFNVSYYKY